MAVTGMAGLRAKLAALPGRCGEAAAEAAVRAAEQAAERARALAPVDTGALKNAIGASGDGAGAAVTAGGDHALYVELGTRRQPPQPFLRPAAEQSREDFLRLAAELAARRLKGG